MQLKFWKVWKTTCFQMPLITAMKLNLGTSTILRSANFLAKIDGPFSEHVDLLQLPDPNGADVTTNCYCQSCIACEMRKDFSTDY